MTSINRLIILTLVLAGSTYCSLQAQSEIGLKIDLSSIEDINFEYPVHFLFTSNKEDTALFQFNDNLVAPTIFSYQELGFFCKVDLKLEKALKIPVRFRLGTVEEVDFLERKGPTRYNY
ncbi:MAG: hypothetical protein KJP00_05585 [Bacteroidia bacterium]|nr:hypothetical protein [Bacteroidia bacterium]